MKLLTLSLFVLLSLCTFSQSESKKAIIENKNEFLKGKENGIFKFILPAGNTKEMITESAANYTTYFTVEFNEKSREATIKMKQNDENGRHIICRFLVSTNSEKILFDQKEFTPEQLYKSYLK